MKYYKIHIALLLISFVTNGCASSMFYSKRSCIDEFHPWNPPVILLGQYVGYNISVNNEYYFYNFSSSYRNKCISSNIILTKDNKAIILPDDYYPYESNFNKILPSENGEYCPEINGILPLKINKIPREEGINIVYLVVTNSEKAVLKKTFLHKLEYQHEENSKIIVISTNPPGQINSFKTAKYTSTGLEWDQNYEFIDCQQLPIKKPMNSALYGLIQMVIIPVDILFLPLYIWFL